MLLLLLLLRLYFAVVAHRTPQNIQQTTKFQRFNAYFYAVYCFTINVVVVVCVCFAVVCTMSCRWPLVKRRWLGWPRKRTNKSRSVCLCTRMRTCLRQAFTVWHFAFLGGAYLPHRMQQQAHTYMYTFVARNTEKCIFYIFSSPFILLHYLKLRFPNLCCRCCCWFLSSPAQPLLGLCMLLLCKFLISFDRAIFVVVVTPIVVVVVVMTINKIRNW